MPLLLLLREQEITIEALHESTCIGMRETGWHSALRHSIQRMSCQSVDVYDLALLLVSDDCRYTVHAPLLRPQ